MKKYNEFIDSNEQINEGIFGFLKKMWNKAAAHIRKVQGGKEVEEIFKKYLGIINVEIQKKANVTLQLGGELKTTKESIILKYDQFLNEEAETDMGSDVEISDEQKKKVQQSGEKDAKMDAKTLEEKRRTIEQIIKLYKDKALKEMEQVLTKQGGAEKNPKLKMIIDNKILEFNLQFLEAEVKYLEKSGDKEAMNKVAAERDKKAKELENMWKKLDATGNVKTEGEGDYKVGNRYQYKTDSGELKVIKITGKSEEEGKIKATFVDEDKEQNFTINNIIKPEEIKIDKNKKYKYYSIDNKNWIIVTIEEDPKGDMVKVRGKKQPFEVHKNTLIPQ